MAEFKNGVKWFAMAKCEINIGFPEGSVKCIHCHYCRPEQNTNRFWCRITNSIIYSPNAEGLPMDCPFELTGEIKGKRE